MPQKIRQLNATLLKAGFSYRPGKGSHTVWFHPALPDKFTLAGGAFLIHRARGLISF